MNFQGYSCNCRNCFCLPSEKESTLKGKNLFPTIFQNGMVCRKANKNSQ